MCFSGAQLLTWSSSCVFSPITPYVKAPINVCWELPSLGFPPFSFFNYFISPTVNIDWYYSVDKVTVVGGGVRTELAGMELGWCR